MIKRVGTRTEFDRLTKFISVEEYELADNLKNKDENEVKTLILNKLGKLENIMELNKIQDVDEFKKAFKQAVEFDDYICTIIGADLANEENKNKVQEWIDFLNYLIEKYESMPYHLKDMGVKGEVIMAFIAERNILENYLKYHDYFLEMFLEEENKKKS